MMRIIFLTVWASMALGGQTSELTNVDGKSQAIFEDRNLGLYLSANCVQPDHKLKCRAYDVLALVSFDEVVSKLKGGVNPGAMICRSVSGELTILKDAKGNENSFCRFGDDSLVSSGTMTRYGRQNDEARQKH